MAMSPEKLKECLIFFVFRYSGRIQRTKLIKLVYLADVLSYRRRKKTITGVDYIYYDYGPWSSDFYDALESTPEIAEKLGFTPFGDVQYTYVQYTYRGTVPEYKFKHLIDEEVELLKEVDAEWGNRPLKAILEKVYSSPPFAESTFGELIDFSKATS